MRPRRLAHDREPEPGARLRPGGGRAVEAVEDPCDVLVGDPGAVVGDDDLAVADGHFDRRAGRAVLDRVVEQVQDGALEQHRIRLHDGRRKRGHERRSRRARLCPLHGPCDQVVELHFLDPQLSFLAAGELDEVRDERRQRSQLHGRLVERAARLVLGQASFAEQVDVRARGGQRRSQLVRSVRDQTALAAHRLLERGEHRVESRA